jgi:SAM-dependent methyltransferase
MRSQEEHFDTVAAEYEATIPSYVMGHLPRRRVARAESLLPAGGSVVDVGCGTGEFLSTLPAGYRRVGLDVSEAMLAVARRKGLDVVHGSGDALPYADAEFDLATTFAVLHHVIDVDRVRATLREMCRVVRPGGAVLVWDHNPLNPYWPILMRRLPQDQGDEKLVQARTIVGELRAAGMSDIRLQRWTFTPEFTPAWALGAVTRLERGLERVPGLRALAAHNVVTARRR